MQVGASRISPHPSLAQVLAILLSPHHCCTDCSYVQRIAGVAKVFVDSPVPSGAGAVSVSVTVNDTKFVDKTVFAPVQFEYYTGISVEAVVPMRPIAGTETTFNVWLKPSDTSITTPTSVTLDICGQSQQTITSGHIVQEDPYINIKFVASGCAPGDQSFTITDAGSSAASGSIQFIQPDPIVSPIAISKNGHTVQASVFGLPLVSDTSTEMSLMLTNNGETVVPADLQLVSSINNRWTVFNFSAPAQENTGTSIGILTPFVFLQHIALCAFLLKMQNAY